MSKLVKIKDIIIYKDKTYNSFPNVLTLKNGSVIVGFRNAPDRKRLGFITHIDPGSKAVFVTSKDRGQTWDSELNLIYDDYLYGVQDPCLNLFKDGTIFATFFMWKAFHVNDVEMLPTDIKYRDKYLGRLEKVYTIRSFDNSETWDEPIPINCFKDGEIALRGNGIELENGDFMLPVYSGTSMEKETPDIFFIKTSDKGLTWEIVSQIPYLKEYGLAEPFLFKTKKGKLVAFIRSSRRKSKTACCKEEHKVNPLIICESYDYGKTWNQPKEKNIYSPSPFHVLQLESNNVLVTYGYRYEPFGIRALILDSECTNIDNAQEFIIRDDGLSTDIGYTSSTQFSNGDILITYYYYGPDGIRYIAGTICREE